MLDQAWVRKEVQPTNLYELKMAFSKDWVNLSQRSNDKLTEPMPRQTDSVVKAIKVSHDMDFFYVLHMYTKVSSAGFV